MVSMSALHSLTAEMHTGFLTLAFACIVIVGLSQVVLHYRHKAPKRFSTWAQNIRGYAEAAGFVGAVGGFIGLILSGVTGMYAWPSDALFSSPVVMNKILLTVFGTVMWGVVVFTRAHFGRGLWSSRSLSVFYVSFTFAAFMTVGLAGSLGAHLTVGESVLDPVWSIAGVDIGTTLALGLVIAIAASLVSLGVVLATVVYARYKRLDTYRVGPASCQNFFKCSDNTVVMNDFSGK